MVTPTVEMVSLGRHSLRCLMPDHLANWAKQSAKLTRAAKPKRGPTPEGAVMTAVLDTLRLLKVGHVIRVNTGALEDKTGRIVRFGEPGHSDLVVELPDGRNAYLELKEPNWRPMAEPMTGAAASTWKKWRHQQEQDAFLARQVARGCPAAYIRSVAELQQFLAQHGLIRRSA